VQIFNSFGILVPIHKKNHWFLVHISFNIAQAQVHLHWYDSWVKITKASLIPATYEKQFNVISSYLQRRYLQFLGDAQTSESQLTITNVVGRLDEDQHGNSYECGIWTCMYASYLTLQLPVDLKSFKGTPSSHMTPVRTWILNSMLKRRQTEFEAITGKSKIDSEINLFIGELKTDVKKESDLLQSYEKILSEINTELQSYANQEQQFKEDSENILTQTKNCELYYTGLVLSNNTITVKFPKDFEKNEAEYNSIVEDISSINIETEALKWPKQQAETLKQLVEKIIGIQLTQIMLFKNNFDTLTEEFKKFQEYSQQVEQSMTKLTTNHPTYNFMRDTTYPRLVNNLRERTLNVKLLKKAIKQLENDLQDKDKYIAQEIVNTFMKKDETYAKFNESRLMVDELKLELSKSKEEIDELTTNMGKIDLSNTGLNAKMEQLFKLTTAQTQPWLLKSQTGTAIMKNYITILKHFANQCLTLEQEQQKFNKYCADVDETKELCRKQLREIHSEESRVMNFIKGVFGRISPKATALQSARILFETLSKEIVTFFKTADEVKPELRTSFDTLQQFSTVAHNLLDIGEKLLNFEFRDLTIPDPTIETQNGANLMGEAIATNIEIVNKVLELKQVVDKTFESAQEALTDARKLQEPEEGNNAGTEPGRADPEEGTFQECAKVIKRSIGLLHENSYISRAHPNKVRPTNPIP
jgi:chromosome segregation ATPase